MNAWEQARYRLTLQMHSRQEWVARTRQIVDCNGRMHGTANARDLSVKGPFDAANPVDRCL